MCLTQGNKEQAGKNPYFGYTDAGRKAAGAPQNPYFAYTAEGRSVQNSSKAVTVFIVRNL